MKKQVKAIINELLESAVGCSITTKSLPIGGGEWSLELYIDDSYVCEFVGSNGTRDDEEAEDLHTLATEAIERAEAIIEFMQERWPKRIFLIRTHSRLIAAEVPEIKISNRISAFADQGGVHLVIVDGRPTFLKDFLKNSSKEEKREFVKGCVKNSAFPSRTILPGHYGRQARRDRPSNRG